MIRGRRHHREGFWRPYAVAVTMIVGLALISYFAFHPRLPYAKGYRVDAVFKSSSGLRKGSPVRIAGVDVGKVVEVGRGPGQTTAVTLELSDRGRPVHRDATVRIRPRVFLEGGYVVDLQPGSPSAPEIDDGGTIPLPQTAVPVQLSQVLSTFQAPVREGLRSILDVAAEGLRDGGAEGLRTLAPELRPLLRDLAWVSQAAQGEQPGDLRRLIAATNRISTALDRNPGQLGDLVGNLATTAQALSDRDRELSASIVRTSRLLQATPRALRSVRAALPLVERTTTRLRPAVRAAPRALGEATEVLGELRALVAPARRERLIGAMETAFRDLPITVTRLAELFPTVKPVTDCLSSHVLPTLEAKVPDGELSTGRPVWQDFVHALVGLASGSQNFDGNGYALRYQFGLDGSTLSTANIPGLGRLLTVGPSNLRSRPLPRPDRKPPPQNPDAQCSDQPLPKLDSPSAPAGVQPVETGPRADLSSITEERLRRLLDPERLRKDLEGTR